jgi:hypothetical protein
MNAGIQSNKKRAKKEIEKASEIDVLSGGRISRGWVAGRRGPRADVHEILESNLEDNRLWREIKQKTKGRVKDVKVKEVTCANASTRHII